MSNIDHIYSGQELIAIIVSHKHQPESTEFVTTPDQTMQVGFVKYPKGGKIQPHLHRHLERHIVGTGEVLFVRTGRVEVFLYDNQRQPVAQRVLEQGDLLLLISGGHGFHMLEDTVLLEVKQGPYIGLDEKERFEDDSGQ
jgi:mannose-6-phosphate isomerase-like protein (cupin superfamily)